MNCRSHVIVEPVSPSPFLFTSPHSGRNYPAEFLENSRLDPHRIRLSEDCFVDELIASVVRHGATFMHALFPRAFLDVNREPLELDPLLFKEPLPREANTGSARVLGGLGTIARVVTEGEEIYSTPPSLEEAMTRIEDYYWPYHQALRGLLETSRASWGYAVLVDCHSMPSQSAALTNGVAPDIILGDRFATSCDSVLIDFAEETLSAMGYMVGRNKPYAGGFITEFYGRPREGWHALQIEINRGTYLDEQKLTRNGNFDIVRQDLETLSERIVSELPPLSSAYHIAAE